MALRLFIRRPVMHPHANPEFRDCIEACWTCRDTCQSLLFNHCIEHGGAHTAPAHIRLMADCIQMCQAAADFMTRGSKMHAIVCNACAATCEACARSCEEIGDEEMKRAAKACRACAESCWDMARHAGLAA
ncbi:MAG: four-helix bundle copper-binding protein [Rhodomicrobium sp.]|nr:four-helix bundle copper-binding protein [Rhodomicrobium sp.]